MAFSIHCPYCQRSAKDIPSLVAYAKMEGMTADEFVCEEEGTYNPLNGHFACDECYIKLGQPVGVHGSRWVAP